MDAQVIKAMQDYMRELTHTLISFIGRRAVLAFFTYQLRDSGIILNEQGVLVFPSGNEEQIQKLFQKWVQEFFTKFITDFGYDFANHIFEQSFDVLRTAYNPATINSLLFYLPENALLTEKIKSLSTEELHERVFSRTRELEELNASLEQQIAERTRQLNEANNGLGDVNKKLIKLDTARKEFLSITSHQMRAALTAIKWTFDVFMQSSDFKVMKEVSQKNLYAAYLQTGFLIRLVQNLLNDARIEDGRFLYSFSTVFVHPFLKDLITAMEFVARTRSVALQYQAPKNTELAIRADAEKIRLVFENLIDNAIKYSPAQSAVSISLQQTSTVVVISVADKGIGIPKTEQTLIFGKFFRASNTKTKSGSGLGLYLAKKIINDHGGSISFDSNEKAGTTFHITFPLMIRTPATQKKDWMEQELAAIH